MCAFAEITYHTHTHNIPSTTTISIISITTTISTAVISIITTTTITTAVLSVMLISMTGA